MAAQTNITDAESQQDGSIITNISLTQTQKEYYQRFVNLSVNEEPLPQGDGMIRISPFDDFFLFTLYDEIDGEDTPIDLSNVGNLFLNFIGTSDEIDIKNHTQVDEVDLSQGEVLFRITRSDSKKILALDNNNFYISTKMIDPVDNSVSDESVLYQGIWLAVDDANRITLTSQIEKQRIEYSIELARLLEENKMLKANERALLTSSSQDTLTIQELQQSNIQLTDEISTLTLDLDSAKLTQLNLAAKNAQANATKQLEIKQQVSAINKANFVAQTGSRNISFFRQAAGNLQNFTIGRNRVGPIDDDLLFNRNNL
tara:strand:- start:328 stop:1269 length:942 start_codon:yes stop_codon:yes gene_type:complete